MELGSFMGKGPNFIKKARQQKCIGMRCQKITIHQVERQKNSIKNCGTRIKWEPGEWDHGKLDYSIQWIIYILEPSNRLCAITIYIGASYM